LADDLRDDIAALVAELRAKRVLVVAAEVRDHFFKVHRDVHRLVVDR
jgi:hypothetical protein